MAAEMDRHRDIVLDPCNRSAERRNTAAIKDSLEAIEQHITNVLNITGDALVPFKVKTSNIGGGSCEVQIADRDVAPWSFTVDFTAHDYSSNGRFGMNMEAGRFGFGRIAPEIGETDLEIIELEGLARFIDGTLAEDMGATTPGEASVSVDNWYGAYPNSAQPPGSLIAVDRLGFMDNRLSGAKFMAIWDEQAREYVMIGPSEADDVGPGAGSPPDLSIYLKIVNSAQIIRITGGSDPCQEIEPSGTCLYDAVIESYSGSDPCNGLGSSSAIKAIAINACSCKGKNFVRQDDRYIAVKVSDDYDGGGNPLWAFRIAEPSDVSVVQVYESPGLTDCEDEVTASSCLYPGKMLLRDRSNADWCSTPFDNTTYDCKIWNATKCNGTADLKHGQRFVGVCVGTSGGIPVFAVQGPEKTERIRWAECVTNWKKGGVGWASVDVKEKNSCDGTILVGAPVINVLLPAPGLRDPNLEAADIIAFAEASDGTYVCVSDYMDDKIGTVKMFYGSLLPKGWELMDGASPSGIDFEGRMPIGGSLGTHGETGGRDRICEQELDHHHKLSMNTPDKISNIIVEESAFTAPQVDKCFLPGNTFGDFLTNADGYLEDDLGRIICVDPAANGNTVDSGTHCNNPFGPINIMNPYVKIGFIERVDNSSA